MSVPVFIAAAGAVNSVGMTLPAVSAAVRGQLNAFRQDDRFPGIRTGKPLVVAQLPDRAPGERLHDRLLAMSLRAAGECLSWLPPPDIDEPPLPIFMSVPPERPGWDSAAGNQLIGDIIAGLPRPVDEARSGQIATGHHGGLAAISPAFALVAEGKAEACLVGGVDGFDIDFLDWMDGYSRLKSDDTPNGIIPGEGAAFMLLVSSGFANRHDLVPAVAIQAAAQAEEPQPWYSGQPVLGQGLSEVLLTLLSPEGHRADVTYCDQNGEVWRADEWSVAYLRTGDRHGSPLDLRHPADCWGDLGAASGISLLALASLDLEQGGAGPSTALITCSSDLTPFRAGVLLAKVERAGT